MEPTINIQISIPDAQLEIIKTLIAQNEKLLGYIKQVVWLDEKEAGERLKVDRQTIARWRKEGWLRYIKEPGEKGRIRYRSDYFDADVEARLGVVKTRIY